MTESLGVEKAKSYSIGALPYRMQIMMPVSGARENKRAMSDSDFRNNEKAPNSFRELMLGFLKHVETLRLLEEDKTGIIIDSDSIDKKIPNELRFIITAGHYGYGSKLQNVRNTNLIKKREVDDCELIPFCCRMIFDENQDSAIIIFEKFGVYSAVTIFKEALRRYVREYVFNGDKYFDVRMMTIVNKRYLEQKFSNSLKAIHLVRYADVNDCANVLHGESELERRIKVRMSLIADRGMFLNIVDMLNPFKTDNFIGVEFDGKKYDEMQLELKSGKRTQTISFTDDMFAIAFDLTDEISVGSDGHPIPETFFESTDDCLEMSKKTIRWVG